MLEFLESLDIESGITWFLIGISISLFILHVVAFVSLARLHSDLNRIADELKFINRRSDIIDVNDSLRHVPRDLKSDFFNKGKE